MRTSPTGLRKGSWTKEEDILLSKCIEKYGEGKWYQVPHRAGLNRCRKSCRLRWLNYLRPNINRGEFSSDEEDLIIRLHKLLGNRWSLIAGRLPGRTANDIKNYWNSHLQKKLYDHGGGSSSSSKKNKKITATTIIKPRPRTFSKSEISVHDTSSTRVINDQINPIITPESSTDKLNQFSMAGGSGHDMQWLDNLLNDEEMNEEGSIWSFFGGSMGDERAPICMGAKEEGDHNCTKDHEGIDFCIDAEIWDLLISDN